MTATDAQLVDVRCPLCGRHMLVPPDAVDLPCGDMRYPGARQPIPGVAECPGKVTASVHATQAQYRIITAFKSRVAALLKKIEWEAGGHEDACPVCFARSTDLRGRPIEKKHLPDCPLAALLKECEG